MHIRLFAIFLSALAIGFSYFGMNDRFALQNSETVRSRPEGWLSDKSIRDQYDADGGNGKCTLENWPKSVECSDVYVDDTKKEKLKSTAATIMPRQNWEIKQGINGKAQRTEKSTISYDDVQLPDDWKIPDLPTNSKIDEYLEHHKDDGRMDDWKLTCLRDEDDNEIGSRYKRIMRDGQNIFDPHALDRELFVVPVRIYGDFKEGSKAAKKAVEDVCTISLIFPTTRRNDLYMFGCYQTSLASHRRAAKKAFGIKDNDDVGELHDRNFAKFIDKIKDFDGGGIDGYTTDATPARDSYLGQWLVEYLQGHAKTTGGDGYPKPVHKDEYRDKLVVNAEYVGGDYLLDGCSEEGKEEAISHRHCTNDNTFDGADLTDDKTQAHGFIARETWAKHVCVNDGVSTLKDIDGTLTPKIVYPIEFQFKDITNSPLVLKTGKKHAEVNKLIECKSAEGAKADHFNLLGGEGSCSIENLADGDKAKYTFRVRQPGINLMDYFGFKATKDSSDTFNFMCTSYDELKTMNVAGDLTKQKGTHTATMSAKMYKTLFKFMEKHVDAHMKHREKTFQGTNIGVVRRHNAEEWFTDVKYNDEVVNSHADGYMWQPLGPNKITASDMCLSTMNTYHSHRTGVTKDLVKHNDLAPYQMLGGMSHTCHVDAGDQYELDSECRGQHSSDQIHANIKFKESFVYSRFATVDLPERQVFRTAQYGWWYRGDDMFNEKMHAMSTLGFHTDALTHDQDSCDSFVHPGSEHTPSQQRFFLEMNSKPTDYHPMVVGASANYPFSAEYSMHGYGVQKGQLTPNDYANTLFTHADEGTATDIKCQNTCKNIKATNGVILVAGALYLISVIGLLLPYDQNKGGANMQTKGFLLLFFVVTTCFTVSLLIHAGSLQRVQSGRLECTFHNDTGFFEGIEGVDIVDNTDTTLGYGLLLLWIGGGFSALCWFITLALVIAVMQGKEDTYISGVSVNEFFFSG